MTTTQTPGTDHRGLPDGANTTEPAGGSGPGSNAGWSRLRRVRWPSWETALLAVLAYIPLLLTARGQVGADTKQYLYLDPDRLLANAPSMWDPNVGMGTVTHQNIGYLWPQGPWYWLFDHLGFPDWVAQRLWSGTLLFLAGLGVVFLLRTLGWRSSVSAGAARFAPAALPAALVYMLSPYVIEYIARISAILLPWAGLPWLVAIVVRGLRCAQSDQRAGIGRWRHPALFALVVTCIGATNATSLIYALIAPILWVPFAVWSSREVRLRPALLFGGRTILLTFGASLWWMAGLSTQAGYGLNVLQFSETVKTVAGASQASEVLRGLGNWFGYGEDGVGPWVQAMKAYTENVPLLALTFVLPLLAMLAAVSVRWIHRAYFVTLIFVGTAISVGVYPYDDPSPLGGLFKAFQEGSTSGLALRSTPRAVPLLVLGFAVLLAGALDALRRRARQPAGLGRLPRWIAPAAYVLVVVLAIANASPLFRGLFVDPNLSRPEAIPEYWKQASAAMAAGDPQTRVLELPGEDFSQYRWGSTLDPVPPGLMDRPFVSRELIPMGTPASAALVRALDRRLQEGVFEPVSLPDLARLMGVGTVEFRSDLQYERFRTPRPRSTWAIVNGQRPAGLGAPEIYGPTIAEAPAVPMTDEITLGTPPGTPNPPAVALFPVRNAVPIVRAERADSPLLIAGDAEGLVDAAAAGLLTNSGVVLFSADLAGKPQQLRQALDAGAVLVVTDSNRRRAERWNAIRENYGYVERVDEKPLKADTSDHRLPVFPNSGNDSQTVAQQRGVVSVEATEYGNPVGYAPADRPDYAVDGDVTTAWRVGAFSDVRGEKLRISMVHPVTTSSINVVQPITFTRNRYVTKLALTFDGRDRMVVDLNDSSREKAGQKITFPKRTFSSVQLEVVEANFGRQSRYNGLSGVGFSEVRIPGVRLSEYLRLPTDLLTQVGAAALTHPLVLQLTRDRANPGEPFKQDTELGMNRTFSLPTARSFGLTGTARISPWAKDADVDRALGRPVGPGVVRADSSGHLPGDLTNRGSSAFDRDPKTVWSTGFGDQVGSWVQVSSPRVVTASSIGLDVLADGRHSVPTRVHLEVDGRAQPSLALPSVPDGAAENATSHVTLRFPTVTGRSFKLVIDDVRTVQTQDYLSRHPVAMPTGFAEVDIAGLRVPPLPPNVPATCRTDLLTVNGKPVGVSVSGSTSDALKREGLAVSPCGASALALRAGDTDLTAAQGRDTGIDLDRLELASAPGGKAAAATTVTDTTSTAAAAREGMRAHTQSGTPAAGTRWGGSPQVSVTGQSSTSYGLHVTGAQPGKPFWLVLGQSLSPGWTASAAGIGDLGQPRLVDGYANGWLVTAPNPSFDVTMTWTPQTRVWISLAVSAVALLGCLLLALWPFRRRRANRLDAEPDDQPLPDVISPLARGDGGARPLTVAATAIGTGLLTGLVITPLAGVIVGVLTALAFVLHRGRALLRLGAVACLLISAAYVVELQWHYGLPLNGSWPATFSKVATISWLAVGLLAADVVVEMVQRSRGRHGQQGGDAPAGEPAYPEGGC